MLDFLTRLRFYGLKQNEYRECMQQTFINNLFSLRFANVTIMILAFIFTLFPFLVERNFIKAAWFLVSAVVAMLLSFFVNHKCNQYKQGKAVSDRLIYLLLVIYYTNVVLFGIYLGVWSNPGKLAVSFMGLLICSLFLFNLPLVFTFCLTCTAIALFITATVLVKSFRDWTLDVANVLFAGSISLFFGWQITKFRMSLAITASKLDEERKKYYDQSLIDELTQLKNRRDFTQTFQRFITNYRQSDNFLCLAIMDIDFFKNYNDHYGHPQGDECLRSVGKVLRELCMSDGLYAARVGGEEFALLWFEEKFENVQTLVARVNTMISSLNIPHEKSIAAPYVTVSIGAYVAQCGNFDDFYILYDLADKALYTAKKNGRNQAVINSSFTD